MSTAEAQKRRKDEGGEITGIVIGAAIDVHKALGPGLLERVYEECLAHELALRGLRYRRQLPLDLKYKGLDVGAAYRMDLLVEEEVVVEVKAIEDLLPVHQAQLLTYLRVGGHPLGLLLNFNVERLPEGGIVRLALTQS
jgi:GxxExxY protein